MMNHHLPAGPPHTALPSHSSPMHHQSRRQQEYHQFHQQAAQNPYAAYGHPAAAYYGHAGAHMGYPPQQRWMPQPYANPMHQYQHQHQHQHQHQQAQFPPRSPVVVSSQPSMAGAMPPPVTRQPSMPYMAPPPPAPSQSPLHQISVAPSPIYQAPPTPATSIPQSLPSPRPASVQTSTPPPTTSRRSSAAQPPVRRMPFYPELPWYSVPSESFPAKAPRRRRKRQDLVSTNDAVALPSRSPIATQESAADVDQSDASTVTAPSQLHSAQETPATSQAPSEADHSTAVTSVLPAETSKPATPQSQAKKDAKPAAPIVPAVPVIGSAKSKTATSETSSAPVADQSTPAVDAVAPQDDGSAEAKPAEAAAPAAKAAPKSWADLVRSKNAAAAAAASATNGAALTNGAVASRANTLAETLKQFKADSTEKTTFLEPRGLVNTGNMCYMNSILQILVYCMPFYNFLDQVSKRSAHSFNSETPLVDAMIMFMKEFKPIDSAESAEKLRMRLKDQELEQYGDSFTPEYVYGSIKDLPRFSSMRRGHQQDAEEFLGFLLEGLHDECMFIMRKAGLTSDEITQSPVSPTSGSAGANTDAGWLEVGPKQKSSVTRQSGESLPTPITRIFGGSLRSELRVPGLKTSVTLEPYQPLQLDIGAPDVSNILQALKGITKPETLTGDFNSPRGPGTTATKQVFIESLPPVLILHLKRFQYDNTGGTQKIWKKVGYPLELEIPKEVFAPQKRGGLNVQGGAPKYRLISVVYHHGKSAAGGHYTVDILRQDEREWVRVDDTIIRRIRPDDVAEGGSEEDPKVLARALEQHKADQEASKRNLFEGLDGDDDNDSVRSWNEVNGQGGTTKKWTSAVTNTSSGKRTPSAKDKSSVKDNKVAYILLYEKMTG